MANSATTLRRGEARRGEARRGEARRGEARRGEARRGEARRGEARRGEARRGEARRGEARRGEARRGEARRGEARRGEARRGDTLPRGIDQRRGRVVLVDECRTSRVSSTVNGHEPCEEHLDNEQTTRPAGWKLREGEMEHRLLRPAWSQQRDQPVRGMMWCPVVASSKHPQVPCSSQAATQASASEPGPSTPPPAKRSNRTKAEQAVSAAPLEGPKKRTKRHGQHPPARNAAPQADQDGPPFDQDNALEPPDERRRPFLPWQERRVRADAAAHVNAPQRKRDYLQFTERHHQLLADSQKAEQNVMQSAVNAG
ncbi:hypothetical protein QJQ45_011069 [Haematococcus lacustris]|nr:hypothetical protein QJQ45_011069 [Haematococcus lacustris]